MKERNWRVGCAGFPIPRKDYFGKLDLVEVQETFYDPPARRTLARWHREAPEDFVFVLRAWQLITHPPSFSGYARIKRDWRRDLLGRFGHFQPGEDVQWAWTVMKEAAENLRAGALVFQTPASFTPTSENRKNLSGFFLRIERGSCPMVWEPEGIWEDQDVDELCRDLRLIPSVDPFLRPPPSGDFFYCRLRRSRHRRAGNYTAVDFSRITDRILGAGELASTEGCFIFNTPDALRDAERFRNWLNERSLDL